MKAALTLAFCLLTYPARAQQTINVSGDAEIKVAPDQVALTLGVEGHSKTLADARAENDRRVRGVREALARAGVAPADIQTDFIQLGMTYEVDGITVKYYYTRKSIVVLLRDVSRMEQALADSVTAGATHIHDVSFETTRLRALRDQARAMAVKAAAEKANDMAAAAGMKVAGGPVSISAAYYGGRSWYGGYWGQRDSGMMSQNVSQQAGPAGGGNGTISPGRISVTAAVAMTFRIQ